MELSANSKKLLKDEITFVIGKMSTEKDSSVRLFYFSAVFGMLNRILNNEFSDDILFAHFILRSAHDSMAARLNQMKQGDPTVMIYEAHFNALISLLAEFSNNIQKEKDIVQTLKKFTTLLYSTTGNGFYLLQKGLLKI
jgi:hypothetical protein